MKTMERGGRGRGRGGGRIEVEEHEKIAGSRLTVTEKRKRDQMDGALAYSSIHEYSR